MNKSRKLYSAVTQQIRDLKAIELPGETAYGDPKERVRREIYAAKKAALAELAKMETAIINFYWPD